MCELDGVINDLDVKIERLEKMNKKLIEILENMLNLLDEHQKTKYKQLLVKVKENQ